MKDHFSSPQWVDLVRGQLDGGTATDIDRHLRDGCDRCAAALRAWQDLAAFAREEQDTAPPDHAVRVVKSHFIARTIEAQPIPLAGQPLVSWASATLARIVFDSWQSVPSSVRSHGSFSRHFIFDAKSLVVDLHIDTSPRAGWFLLSGQVADASRPDQPLENVWLSLVDDRQEISMFPTNEFGEFRCSFNFRRALKLMVYAGRQVVAIPIETLFDPSSDPGDAATIF